MSQAFKSIMNKNIKDEDAPILAKYKKPSKVVQEESLKEKELADKKKVKALVRIMGRHIPTAQDEEHEREFQIIATKGVV
jgi:hypothetical protein